MTSKESFIRSVEENMTEEFMSILDSHKFPAWYYQRIEVFFKEKKMKSLCCGEFIVWLYTVCDGLKSGINKALKKIGSLNKVPFDQFIECIKSYEQWNMFLYFSNLTTPDLALIIVRIIAKQPISPFTETLLSKLYENKHHAPSDEAGLIALVEKIKELERKIGELDSEILNEFKDDFGTFEGYNGFFWYSLGVGLSNDFSVDEIIQILIHKEGDFRYALLERVYSVFTKVMSGKDGEVQPQFGKQYDYMSDAHREIVNSMSKTFHENLKTHNLMPSLSLTFPFPFDKVVFSMSQTSLKINITSYNEMKTWYNSTYVQGVKELHSSTLVLYPSGKIFCVTKNQKFIPMSFNMLHSIARSFTYAGKLIYDLVMKFLISNGHVVAKDVMNFQKERTLLPKVLINDALDCRTPDEMFKKKWKFACHFNWNKTNWNVAYLASKSLPFIQKEDQARFIQTVYQHQTILEQLYRTNIIDESECDIVLFLAQYLDRQISSSSSHDLFIVKDYIKFAMELKEPINIKFKSVKKIHQAHDHLCKLQIERQPCKVITIPKKTKFAKLRDMLPDSFEWITTGKRLKQEGMMMHHCVYTYADMVNNDQCAIYSLIYDGIRYTIEFRVNALDKSTYRIIQIQSACNQGCPKELWDYVESLLNEKKAA